MEQEQETVKTEVISLGEIRNCKILPKNDFQFIIPSIQRDYQWGIGNDDKETGNDSAYAFIEDLIRFYASSESNEDPYFLGTFIVFNSKETDDVNVMDGQQRWTTLTALMSAIYHLLDSSTIGELRVYKNEIIQRFLQTKDGRPILLSKVDLDNQLIEIMCEFDSTNNFRDEKFSEQRSLQGNFKRGGKKYSGRNLFCVLQYFIDRLGKEFSINGPLSPRDALLKFYQVIRDRVLINLTLSESSKLAYKMFVTANARGTPLTNFDILRGLVLSKYQEITGKENNRRLNGIFSECDSYINNICIKLKSIDLKNNLTNQIISDALGVRMKINVTKASSMGYLESEINKIQEYDELIIFSEYFESYFYFYSQLTDWMDTKLPMWGLINYSNIKYAQNGKTHQSFVLLILSYICSWTEEERKLLTSVIRCFYIRTDICTRSGNKIWYRIIPKFGNRMLNPGGESRQQFIKNLASELSKESPSFDRLKSELKIKQWEIYRSEKNKLISLFYAIEDRRKILKHKGQGYGLCSQLMPEYQWDFRDSDWLFGQKEKNVPKTYSNTIGNIFLLNGVTKEIEKLPFDDASQRISEFREKSAGTSSGNILLDVEDWGSDEIKQRTVKICDLIEAKFPSSCFNEEWIS